MRLYVLKKLERLTHFESPHAEHKIKFRQTFIHSRGKKRSLPCHHKPWNAAHSGWLARKYMRTYEQQSNNNISISKMLWM